MRFGSLFAGVGGFDLALERAGVTPTWSVELDPQCRAVLRRHWPDVPHFEDVHDIGSGLAPVDLICGGFPCQDYSVAGKRGGLVGDRGALWWEMHRIIAECRPTWVVGENVPGLLSSSGGQDFATILSSLVGWDVPTPRDGWGNAGLVQGRPDHYGVVFAVVDSQFFAVAQRRRRLFIVGHLGGEPRPEILALSEGLYGHPAPSREAGEGAAGGAGSGAYTAGSHGGYRSGVGTLRSNGGDIGGGSETIVAHTLRAEGFDASEDGTGRGTPIVTTAVCAKWAKGTSGPAGDEVANVVAQVSARGGAQQDEFVAHRDVTGALAHSSNTHGGNHQPKVFTSAIPRRLTPVECSRLQSFPDDWTEWGVREDGSRWDMADGPRYRMLGNAVTVNVVEWIGRRIAHSGSTWNASPAGPARGRPHSAAHARPPMARSLSRDSWGNVVARVAWTTFHQKPPQAPCARSIR